MARARAELQAKQTKAAKRRLKQRARRESRHAAHTNHKIAKAIVSAAERTGRGIALEDLEGIRERVRLTRSQRGRISNWPFYQLAQHIAYKAKRAGVPVVVGPFTLEPVEVAHPIPAFGVRVTGPSSLEPGRSVTLAYTGDTDLCDGVLSLAAGADLLLAEAAYVEGRDDASRGVHLTGRRAGLVAADGGVGRLVLTHLVEWNDPQMTLAEARGVFAGPIDLAAPGAVYTL